MKLIIVRHGESRFNVERRVQGWKDAPLTERGRNQAERVADRLKDVKIDAIYASDLCRAFDTAKKIAEFHGLTVTPVKDFREQCFGDLEGFLRPEADKIAPNAFENREKDPDFVMPGTNGESFNMMADRVKKALDKIIGSHPDQTVLVVTHGGPKRAMLYKLGLTEGIMTYEELIRNRFTNTSVTELEIKAGKAEIICLNCGKHLLSKFFSLL